MTGEEKQAAEEHVPEVSEPMKQYTPRKRAEHLTEEEMNMAALAHASVLLGFITGGLAGVAIAFIIWLIYKDKSRYVAFQAVQAVALQLALIGVTIAAVVAIVVSALTICLIPMALVLLLGGIA